MNKLTSYLKSHPYVRRFWEMLIILVLALYPLRHIHRGLDLWDTGYNYANFMFMGTDSMDPMWLFSTYLSTAVGHILTLLPFGKTLLGLNFYTSLSISVTAVISYFFCTRELKIPRLATFIAEFVALSFCWCPTALLYNYLTYLLMNLAIIFIYRGLSKGRAISLFIAGVCLGLNLFVRFSNLPQVAFILGVWAYGFLEVLKNSADEAKAVKKRERVEGFFRTLRRTLWCMAGYFFAAGIIFMFVGLKYGFGEYVSGIKRLFAMTDTATSYSAYSMVMKIFTSYYANTYWLIRIAFFMLCGTLLCSLGKHIDAQFGIKSGTGKTFGKKFTFLGLAYFLSIAVAIFCLFWMNTRPFIIGEMDEYGAIEGAGVTLTAFMIIISIAQIFWPKISINDKLIAGLMLLLLGITPIGSNNGLYPSFNNLFIALPWYLGLVWKLLCLKEQPALTGVNAKKELSGEKKSARVIAVIKSLFSAFGIKAVVVALCFEFFIPTILFGWHFQFGEARNLRNAYYTLDEVPALNGIRLSYTKAANLYGIYTYINENELSDRELITYGKIPGTSFYLQMPSAFNPWMDLASYSSEVLIQALGEAEREYIGVEKDWAVIVTIRDYAGYFDGINDEQDRQNIVDPKWQALFDYIIRENYVVGYTNDYYAVFVKE